MKKAISPVVAIALLLVVAVVAVVGFQNWFGSFSSEVFADVEQKGSNSANTDDIEAIIGDELYFKNGKSSNLTIQEIKIGDKVCNLSEFNISSGMNNFSLANCTQNIDSGYYDVVVVTNQEVISRKMHVVGTDPPFVCTTSGSGFYAGSGSLADPYQICNCSQLQNMQTSLSSSYVLINDIDCSMTSSWNSNAGFVPVGSLSSNPFKGSFDGQDYTITGLHINRPSTFYQALFGVVGEASDEIKNIYFEDVNITGSSRVGALFGQMIGITNITNIQVKGEINVTSEYGGGIGGELRNTTSAISFILKESSFEGEISISGGQRYVGGLVGFATNANFENNFAIVNISGAKSFVGGLIGEVRSVNDNYIQDSFAIVNFTNPSTTAGTGIGGLTGDVNGVDIHNSYSKGSIVANANSVGGLIGDSSSGAIINNSYSWVDVSTTGNNVGGLTGDSAYIYVYSSYSKGSVSGSSGMGGLSGQGIHSDSVSNYWDTQTSGQTTSTFGTGKTTAEMTEPATFTGWDTNVWNLNFGEYPSLAWE